MADYMPAVIYIGGALPAERFAELMDAVVQDGVTDAGGGAVADERTLGALIDGRDSLMLAHPDATFGALPALEAACEALGLTYRRESEAKYEYEAEVVSWAPGLAAPRRTPGTQDGTPVVAVETIREVLDAPAASDAEVVARLRAVVDAHTPVAVPPLVLTTAGA